MRAFLVFLLFGVYALFARWYYVCQIKHLCDEEIKVEDVRLKTLRLVEADTVILEGYDQFAFDSTNVRPRMNENNSAFLDTIAAYLKLFPQKNLTITGLYRNNEDSLKVGFYENIGVARAAEVRKLLMRRNIDEKRISLDYQRTQDSLLQEPLLFNILSGTPEEFEIVQFSFTNMTFSDANFAFDSDEFKPGEPFVAYADSVKTYLALNPEKVLTIIGHTDNVGTNKYNQDLGLRRAKSARTYFKDLGVIAKINVDSRGESRPAATNESDEGRQKNRRVNFVLE
ncbi:MAG: OmpA family protein [Saprospiraceae bacterium]|nr:OmpA family protein [Saprospiraceae bacterium]